MMDDMLATLFAQTDVPRFALDAFVREHWRIVVPLLAGFVGIYLLLPRVRRSAAALGGALAGLGLVLAGLWWLRPEGIWIENLLFYAFSGLAVLGAGLMLSQHNPVHSALSFAVVVLSTCGLFLLLAAPFLMAATLIIYAGAIVVTFLFVIMLAQQAGLSSADTRSREPFLASLTGLVLLGSLIIVLDRAFDTRAMDATLEKLERLAGVGSRESVVALLGEPPAMIDGDRSSPLLTEIRQRFPELSARDRKPDEKTVETARLVDNLENAWVGLDNPKNVARVAELGDKLLKRGRHLRQHGDVLEPSKGPPSLLERAESLPAKNVAGLGRMLFTEYLIPVEMAGVLLLVATIGAIAIAGRRTEGLR